jgi:hypothetical protein
MKRLFVLLMVLLTTVAGARVPRDGELTYSFRLTLENGLPYISATLQNHTSAPMEFELPAGLRLNGRHEPCLPVVVGQDVQFKMAPGEAKTLKFQALSLYIFKHTEGEYEVASFMDSDELALSGKLQDVWSLHYRNQLSEDPFRVCQLMVYLHNGADVGQLSSMFSAKEMQTARRI